MQPKTPFILAFVLAISFLPATVWAECYTYDPLGRLKNLAYDDVGGSSMTYTFDKHGNREQVETERDAGENCLPPPPSTSNAASTPVLSASISDPAQPNRPPTVSDRTVYMRGGQFMTASLPVYDLDADSVSVVSATTTATNITVAPNNWPLLGYRIDAESDGTAQVNITYSDSNNAQASGILTVIVSGTSGGGGGGDLPDDCAQPMPGQNDCPVLPNDDPDLPN